MSETAATLETYLKELIGRVVEERLWVFKAELNGNSELLTPEELANKLKVPLSWVYEQSRQGKIPTHRIGRYIRFDVSEVLTSQKKS